MLLQRFTHINDARRFIDLTPVEALRTFKELLPSYPAGCLQFAFSDAGLLNILEYEFDVNLERHGLVFRKSLLDAESIRLANAVQWEFNAEETDLIEHLTQWLFDVTRSLYRVDLSASKERDIYAEYRESFKLYAEKYAVIGDKKLYKMFGSRSAMTEFTHAMTVDAMYKADAAKALFGPDSAYYQAWLRKQMFRHMITQSVEKYITSYAA